MSNSECSCTDTKQIVKCELERGDGPCLTTKETNAPQTTGQQPAPLLLGSDALTNSIAAKLGATITTNIEGS